MARRTVNIINIRTKKKKKVYINSGSTHEVKGNIIGTKIYLSDDTFVQSLIKYIGQTVTIYTASGGDSGSGFTGVILDVKKDYIKVLSSVGSPPEFSFGNSDVKEELSEGKDMTSLGTITNIPINKIAAFVHNTI